MSSKYEQLKILLQEKKLQGFLILHQPNITYLTGFLSFDSCLFITLKKCFFITDSRYYLQAKGLLKGIKVLQDDSGGLQVIAQIARKARIKRLGFELKNLTVAQYKKIKKALSTTRLIATFELIERLRQIKQASELRKIKHAVKIAVSALRYARRIAKPGLKEIQLAASLERFIRYQGARTSAFETIVAAGVNSCYPHHLTSERKLRKNEPLLVDIGVDYQGYKSDLTRTFFLDKIPSKFSKIYDIVQQAQIQVIKRIKPGIKASEIDKCARQYISNHGYGGFFSHSLGHGIGLEIHEKPFISSKNYETLKPAMVITAEPAIYLPKKFGIRIEDDILVTKNGCEVLSADLNK